MVGDDRGSRPIANWNCNDCSADDRRQRNCDGESNPRFRVAVGQGRSGFVLRRCPYAEVTPFTRYVLKHYVRLLDRNLLPRAGGTDDQDARLMAAFDVLDRELQRLC